MTPAAVPYQPLERPRSPWSPQWRPAVHSAPAAVTVVCTPRDDPQYMALAFAAHQPCYGRVTVHPTPVAGNGFYLAHDLMRAYGKHLPVPGDGHAPDWTTSIDDNWRFAAAWTMALGITHLTLCRAHTASTAQWQYLLALSVRTGIQLTMLCNGPLPRETAHLLTTVEHRCIQDLSTAQTHWHTRRGPAPGGYPWWAATAAFPPASDEVWFRLPPQPTSPRTGTTPPPGPPPGTPTAQLPGATACQDHGHPHIARTAARIHTRIAHPVHAATAALRVLSGYTNEQISTMHHLPRVGVYDPTPGLPLWAALLTDAARCLAELLGHRNPRNLVSTPQWEHPEIDQALQDCRLLPSLPARRSRSTGTSRTAPQSARTARRPPSAPKDTADA